MHRRTLVMTGVVAGSIALGVAIGATVFAPRVGLAASGTDAGQEVVAVCAGVLGADVIATAADAIGIEPQDLVSELRDGKTIAEVAEANGAEVSAVVDAVVAALQERLDAAVENGWITQEQADERAADLQEQATSLVNGDLMPFPGPFGHGPMPFPPPWSGSDDTSVSTAAASQA
jgi:hypothetical protein